MTDYSIVLSADSSGSIVCPIAHYALERPDAIAVKDKDTSITFLELDHLTKQMASIFLDLKVQRGERIGVVSQNRYMLIPVLFALHRLHASALFLNLQLAPDDWSLQLKMGKVRVVLGENGYLDQISGTSFSKINIDELEKPIVHSPLIDSSDTAFLNIDQESSIVFTSSQTGHKKGVILSIRNFLSSAEASNLITKITEGDTWAVTLPLYHVGGLGIVYRTLLSGAASFFLNTFSPKEILPLIRSTEITHISVVPTVLESLIDLADSVQEDTGEQYPLKGLKSAILAGAASSSRLIKKIDSRKIPVLSAWGMTETTAHCTCMSLDDSLNKITTVGKPFYHTELGIIDDQGDFLPKGTEGEIIVKGPTVCSGYLDPDAPQPVVIADWLHSGDLGVLDDEGYLTIVGRKDDMFISGGENIHASEIEEAGLMHPEVLYAAAIPVSHPKWGHRPILFVQLKEECDIDEAEMISFLAKKLAKIKVPDRIIFLNEFRRTAIGKIDYKYLKISYSE
jgi:o-succinylbenzoate---CoA ligase